MTDDVWKVPPGEGDMLSSQPLYEGLWRQARWDHPTWLDHPLKPNAFEVRSGARTLGQANLELHTVALLRVKGRHKATLWTLSAVRKNRIHPAVLAGEVLDRPVVSLGLVCAVARLYLQSIAERAKNSLRLR